MTLQRVMAGLASRHPSEDKMVPDLERISLLCDLMGSPQQAYPAIHLTGTNGKTSTARMVDALVRARGLRTGRFTSPHVESMTERISVDGDPMSEETFLQAYNDIAPYVRLVVGRDLTGRGRGGEV